MVGKIEEHEHEKKRKTQVQKKVSSEKRGKDSLFYKLQRQIEGLLW